MLAVAIIVFREALEAGLIISITAASVGIHGRNTWISGGIVGDVAGVGLIALFAASIAQAFAVSGQDVLNASILLVAFIMLGWHVAWIARLVALSTPLSGRVTRALAWGGMIVGGSLFAPNVAKAEIHVRSPLVEFREFEFEMNGLASTKSTAGQFNGGQSYTYALGYAPLPWYKFEVELETSAQLIEPGADGTDPLQLEAQTFENFFQFTPDGKYFVNAGFFVEYSHGLLKNSPNNVSFGPLLSKEIGVFPPGHAAHIQRVPRARDRAACVERHGPVLRMAVAGLAASVVQSRRRAVWRDRQSAACGFLQRPGSQHWPGDHRCRPHPIRQNQI